MTRSNQLTANYSDWTKAQLIERLEKLQHPLDEREPTEFALSRLAAMVESSPDAIIGLSVDGIISD